MSDGPDGLRAVRCSWRACSAATPDARNCSRCWRPTRATWCWARKWPARKPWPASWSRAPTASWPVGWTGTHPQAVGVLVRLAGQRRPGTRDRGLVLTLHFEGDAISLVQEQRTPPPPVEAQAHRAAGRPATPHRQRAGGAARHTGGACRRAGPADLLSFRGSVQVHADDQLALWVRNAEGGFIQAIRANPRVALMYRDEEAKATYQFQGRARVTDAPAERQRIFQRAPAAERAHDFAQLGAAVVVDLDRRRRLCRPGPAGQVGGIRMLREGAASP